jgi:CubicO group peptidase (beta-lactamase class C family)
MRCPYPLPALLLLTALCARAAPSFRDIIQPQLDTHAIAGAVTLVADREGILSVEAFGLADRATGKAMTTELLSYPLTDPSRQPIPGGGLFSTAADLARFYRMILNQGELDGRRYLTAESVWQMTSKQTGDAIEDGYGFGWMTKDGAFGHSGSLNAQSSIDPATGLLTVLLVQQKRFIANGTDLKGDFKRAAKARFAGPPAPPPNR